MANLAFSDHECFIKYEIKLRCAFFVWGTRDTSESFSKVYVRYIRGKIITVLYSAIGNNALQGLQKKCFLRRGLISHETNSHHHDFHNILYTLLKMSRDLRMPSSCKKKTKSHSQVLRRNSEKEIC